MIAISQDDKREQGYTSYYGKKKDFLEKAYVFLIKESTNKNSFRSGYELLCGILLAHRCLR
jgi:hypothetical protein